MEPAKKAAFKMTERKRWGFFAIPWTFTTYTLTSKRLLVRSGFFRSHEDEILLYRVQDHSLTRTFFQKVFGTGSINVISTDKSLPDLLIKNVKNSRKFRDRMASFVEKEKIRLRVRRSEVMHDDGMSDDRYDYMH